MGLDIEWPEDFKVMIHKLNKLINADRDLRTHSTIRSLQRIIDDDKVNLCPPGKTIDKILASDLF